MKLYSPPTAILYANIVAIRGGAEESLLDLLDTLDCKRVRPEVLLLDRGPLEESLRQRGLPVHVIEQGQAAQFSRGGRAGMFTLLRAFLAALGCGWRIAGLVRARGIRIFHSNSYKTHYLSVFVRLFTPARVVWHLRDVTRPTREGRFFAWLAGFVPHAIVANSRATRAALGEGSRAWARAQVIYNGIDIPGFSSGDRESQRRRWGLTAAETVILHVGMLCPLKGQHCLLAAAPRIFAAVANARIVFVGAEAYATGDPELVGYADSLRRKAAALQVDGRIVWAGLSDNMADAYAACDLLVSCSTQPESFGRCLAEAMAAGRTVVTFAEGGPAEIVIPGETGLQVPPGNIEKLADAVIGLCRDQDRREALARAGRERARARFDRSSLGPAVMRLYETLGPVS